MIGVRHDFAHLLCREHFREIGVIQNNADILFGRCEIRTSAVCIQGGEGAAVRLRGAHQQADQGAFAGAVFADQTQNRALGQGKADILKGKTRIVFGNVFHCNGIHDAHSFSNIWIKSMISPVERPQMGASSSAARRWDSSCFRCSSRMIWVFFSAT